jgi:hypothetical protein
MSPLLCFVRPLLSPCCLSHPLASWCHFNSAMIVLGRLVLALSFGDSVPSPGRTCCVGSDALRQGVTVRLYELVHDVRYLVEGKDTSGVTVEHRGMVDVVAVAFKSSTHGEVLDRRVWGAVGGELGR